MLEAQLLTSCKLSGGEHDAASPEEAALDREMDLAEDLAPAEFRLPPPREFSDDERNAVVKNALGRISEGAKDLAPMDTDVAEGTDMWMLLIVRLVTRVTDPTTPGSTPEKTDDGMDVVSEFYAHQDRLRQTLCDYIMADFPGR